MFVWLRYSQVCLQVGKARNARVDGAAFSSALHSTLPKLLAIPFLLSHV